MSSALEERAALHRVLGDANRLAIVDALRWSDRTPSQLAAATGLSSNLLAFHLAKLEGAGLVVRTASEGDARRRYVRLQPSTLRRLTTPVEPVTAERVLFVCTRNASRSQLAAALWVARTGRVAASAGREPAAEIDPTTVAVARDRELELVGDRPRGYAEVELDPDLVVSVCDRAGEAEPPFAAPRLHWSIPDPLGGSRAEVEAVLDQLTVRIDALAADVREAA
jgi:ArsR family transcriptional regulator, arsenate/arsenite/antimonite-responsive transcriptional repressor / arsenate reductase (thioredoxin)